MELRRDKGEVFAGIGVRRRNQGSLKHIRSKLLDRMVHSRPTGLCCHCCWDAAEAVRNENVSVVGAGATTLDCAFAERVRQAWKAWRKYANGAAGKTGQRGIGGGSRG